MMKVKGAAKTLNSQDIHGKNGKALELERREFIRKFRIVALRPERDAGKNTFPCSMKIYLFSNFMGPLQPSMPGAQTKSG